MNLNNEQIIVAIENAVIEQVEASGFTGELHRLDGEKIVDVILQQIEGFVLVPREPTEEMLGAAWEAPPVGGPSTNRRIFHEKQTVVYKAMVDEAEKAMIEAQEQSHE